MENRVGRNQLHPHTTHSSFLTLLPPLVFASTQDRNQPFNRSLEIKLRRH
jgi:hypothetical protein